MKDLTLSELYCEKCFGSHGWEDYWEEYSDFCDLMMECATEAMMDYAEDELIRRNEV